MKILAFVDLHGSRPAMKKLKKKAEDCDIILCAGDISIFEQNLYNLLKELSSMKKPVLIIPGNHESDAILRRICNEFKNITFLHKKTYRKGNHLFLGYGGGGFSLKDPYFKKIAGIFDEKRNKDDKVILMLHGPPYGSKTDLILDQHCGNKTYMEYINKSKPMLVVCGHLHETAGVIEKKGKTVIVNPGPYGQILLV